MRILVVLALLALPEPARVKRLEQAGKLEKKAEKLLDQGKRTEAFDALARAAELRRKAAAKTEPEPKPNASPDPRAADPVEVAHGELDAALRKGDLEAARKASVRLHEARAAQARRIAALEAQLDALREQVIEIRALLQPEKRPK